MNTNDFFSKKICFENGKKINAFWKENKMKGGSNDALLLGRESHTAKNYIKTGILSLISFFFSVVNGHFKNV